MMIKRLGYLKWVFVCLTGLLLLSSPEIWGTDWRLLSNQSSNAYYVDADSVRTLDNKNIQVWGKEILSEEKKSKIIKNLGDAFTHLHSASVLFEINCQGKMIKALMVEFYSHDGFIISSDSFDGAWEIIIPDTTQDALRKNTCK
jgi:hypothetical protein